MKKPHLTLEEFINNYKRCVTDKVKDRIGRNNGLDYEFHDNDLKYLGLASGIADQIHYGHPFAPKGDVFRALLAIAVAMYYDGTDNSIGLIRQSVEEEILNAEAASK